MSKCVDFIGQEVKLGDWCTVTQYNCLYVGKVIKTGSTVTIACSSIDEYILTDKKFSKITRWEDKRTHIEARFGPKVSWLSKSPTWARDGKFVKITPTQKMLIDYDTKR